MKPDRRAPCMNDVVFNGKQSKLSNRSSRHTYCSLNRSLTLNLTMAVTPGITPPTNADRTVLGIRPDSTKTLHAPPQVDHAQGATRGG